MISYSKWNSCCSINWKPKIYDVTLFLNFIYIWAQQNKFIDFIMEIIPSNKGGKKLCYLGYMYTKKHTSIASKRWECSSKGSLGCKGRLTTDLDCQKILSYKQHNHSPDSSKIEATKVRQAMKQRALIEGSKTGKILLESMADMTEEGRAALGHLDSIKRTIRRHRQINQPKVPLSLLDLHTKGNHPKTALSNEKTEECKAEQTPEDQVLNEGPISRHHKAILSRMCRVCGTHCYEWNTYIRCTETFKEKALTLGVDVSNDDPAVHPRGLCERCHNESTRNQMCRRSSAIEKYEFCAHSDKDCQVCQYACSACLLVPMGTRLKGGGYDNYVLSLDWVQIQRHDAICKAIEFLQEHPHHGDCTSKLLNKKISNLAEHKNNNCDVCGSPCPLCRTSTDEADGLFLARCNSQLLYNKPLRKRKMVECTESEPEVVDQTPNVPDSKRMLIATPKFQPSKRLNQPTILPKPGHPNDMVSSPTNLFTISTQKVQAFGFPVVANTQTSSFVVENNSLPTKNQTPMRLMIRPPQPPQIMLSSPPPSTISNPVIFNTSMQSPPAPNTQHQNPMSSGTFQCNILPNSFDRSSNQLHQNAHKTNGKQPPDDAVEFGTAPRIVARAFHETYKAYGSLTECIKQALLLVPHLKYKYKFISQTNPSDQCILIGLMSQKDNPNELQKQLVRLDNYVKENRLISRASAIEELLFSYCQTDHRIVDEDADDVNSMLINEGYARYLRGCETNYNRRRHCRSCDQTFDDVTTYRRHFGSFAHKHRENILKCGMESNNIEIGECLNSDDVTTELCKTSIPGCPSHLDKSDNSDSGLSHSSSYVEPTQPREVNGRFTGIIPMHYKPFDVETTQDGKFIRGRCKFCSFTSTKINSLVYHARKHVGDYPFRCSKCAYAAISKAMLNIHQKTSSHRGFYVIRRSNPLTREEVKHLDAMMEKYVTCDDEDRPKVSASKVDPGVDSTGTVSDGTKSQELYNFVFEDMDSDQDEDDNDQSLLPTSPGEEEFDSWMFCGHCNSAFLDDGTYKIHVKKCTAGNIASNRDSTEESPAEDICSSVKREVIEEFSFNYITGCSDDEVDDEDSLQQNLTPKDPICVTTGLPSRTRKVTSQKRAKLSEIIAGLSGSHPLSDTTNSDVSNIDDVNEDEVVDNFIYNEDEADSSISELHSTEYVETTDSSAVSETLNTLLAELDSNIPIVDDGV